MRYQIFHFTRLENPRRGLWRIRCYIQYGADWTTEYTWYQFHLTVERGFITYCYLDNSSFGVITDPTWNNDFERKVKYVAYSKMRNILKSMNRGGVSYRFNILP